MLLARLEQLSYLSNCLIRNRAEHKKGIMSMSKFLAAVAAASLAVAPTVATAQSAPVSAPAPASETVQGSELSGGWFLPAAIVIAIIVGIILIVNNDDDSPVSK